MAPDRSPPPRWRGILTLTYAHLVHLAFLAVLAAGLLFLSGAAPWFSIDGPARAPLGAALVLGFVWITPHMSVGHLVLALGLGVYALIGTVLEERTLLRLHGAAYERYRREVPMLLPRLWPSR